jgi:hypothetical protein
MVDNATFFELLIDFTAYNKIKNRLLASFLNKKVPAQGFQGQVLAKNTHFKGQVPQQDD